jgi:hypothetical protein
MPPPTCSAGGWDRPGHDRRGRARLRRRRLHRRDRRGQRPAPGGAGHPPAVRPAAPGLERRRCRCRGRRPQEPKPAPGRRRGPVPGRPAVAAGAGDRAAVLQVLLDLRLDRRRQHRAGRRRPAEGGRGLADGRLPGLARARPDRAPGPPVRRRPAAVRVLDAPPPADPDDRSGPGPGAGAPDPRAGSAWSPPRWSARARRRCSRHASGCGIRVCGSRSPTPSTTGTWPPSPPPAATCR